MTKSRSSIRKIKVPGTTVQLLTATTKMPGPSWSLPAHKSCPRANGDICDSCYAENGCYRYRETRHAQETRFRWTVECMRTDEGFAQWVSTIVDAIQKLGCTYFRVHDSGDMFNPRYAQAWLEVCRQLLEVRFWISTRTWQQPSGALPIFDPIMATMRELAKLPNVTVRPSALNFGDHAPIVAGLHSGSTAAMTDVFRAAQCPAYRQGGYCGACRTCWDDKDIPVSYSRH